MVQNRVTLDNATSFELDKSNLNAPAIDALRQVLASMSNTRIAGDILIVGHTCSLGSDEYNQGLSERRAKTVYDYLANQNVDSSRLKWEGHGEREPRYSNDTEESRKRNRRVEITFLAETEVVHEVPVGDGEPVKEWVQEKVPVEAAWIRRALRNPVMHKRSVDYYQYNRVTENLYTGDTILSNLGPVAVDDVFEVNKNSGTNTLAVLPNDSDPEGDALTIVSVTNPAHGSVSITEMGTVVINGDGTVTYDPMPGWWGGDSFQYRISDGRGGEAMATVVLDVTPN